MLKELLQKLNDQLKGQKIGDTWDIEGDISRVFKQLLSDKGVNEKYTSYSALQVKKSSCARNDFIIQYRGYFIATITIKRVRGDIHHSWFSNSYYDWSYGDFTSNSNDFDFIDRVMEIERTIAKRDMNEKEKFDNMFAIYKQLAKICEGLGYKTDEVIDYCYENSWTIKRTLEKEGKSDE